MTAERERAAERQEALDRFYWNVGPCCAGCDWWWHHNAIVGECTRSAPVAAEQRTAMIDISHSSLAIGAGHVFTKRAHRCGSFVDSFDWASLPLAYAKRVGAHLKEDRP